MNGYSNDDDDDDDDHDDDDDPNGVYSKYNATSDGNITLL